MLRCQESNTSTTLSTGTELFAL